MSSSRSDKGAPGASGWADVTWVDVVEVDDGGEPIIDQARGPCGTPGCELLDRQSGVCSSQRGNGARKRRLPAALADTVKGSDEEEAVPDEASHRGTPARKQLTVGSTCEHGRQRSLCKDCGGSGICEHRRRRSQCKDCGGGSICQHGKVRNLCKDCGGSSICEHGRQRSMCKECGELRGP